MKDHSFVIETFKGLPRAEQVAALQEMYVAASEKVDRIINDMDAMNAISQHFQDMQRVEGATLPEKLIDVFRRFQSSSAAMSDCWIRNNAIVQRCYQLHQISTKQHPSFKL